MVRAIRWLKEERNANHGNLSIVLNNGDGTFATPVTKDTGKSRNTRLPSPTNNDGIPIFCGVLSPYWILVSCWVGYTLDLMRHDPGAPNGMTEFLIARCILAAAALALSAAALTRLSMNFAMWGRGAFLDDVDFTPAQKLARRAGRGAQPVLPGALAARLQREVRLRRLPRAPAFRSPADLPRVGLLYAGAEGFLAVPGLGPLFVPAAVGGTPAPSAAPAAA